MDSRLSTATGQVLAHRCPPVETLARRATSIWRDIRFGKLNIRTSQSKLPTSAKPDMRSVSQQNRYVLDDERHSTSEKESKLLGRGDYPARVDEYMAIQVGGLQERTIICSRECPKRKWCLPTRRVPDCIRLPSRIKSFQHLLAEARPLHS